MRIFPRAVAFVTEVSSEQLDPLLPVRVPEADREATIADARDRAVQPLCPFLPDPSPSAKGCRWGNPFLSLFSPPCARNRHQLTIPSQWVPKRGKAATRVFGGCRL